MLALLIAITAALLVPGGSDSGRRVATAPKGAPRRIVAIASNDEAVVLSTATGKRAHAAAAPGYARSSEIAVSPDARELYYVRGDSGSDCSEHTIVRMPLGRDGPRVTVARGATDPSVSPDGGHLAFVRCARGFPKTSELVLHDLDAREDRVVSDSTGSFTITGLHFAPDSRHAMYRVRGDVFDNGRSLDGYFDVDLVGGEALPGLVLPLDASVDWSGYRGTTGELLGVAGRAVVSARLDSPPYGPHRLFELPRPPRSVAADRTGRHVLAVAGDSLYRWTEGDGRPTLVGTGYVAAAWLR